MITTDPVASVQYHFSVALSGRISASTLKPCCFGIPVALHFIYEFQKLPCDLVLERPEGPMHLSHKTRYSESLSAAARVPGTDNTPKQLKQIECDHCY